MILDVELLQLYRCKQLSELLNRTGSLLASEGFPYLSLDWTPTPSAASTMLANASGVWDNYSDRLGDKGVALAEKMASSLPFALMRDRENTTACQAWKTTRTAAFAMHQDAPQDFLLVQHQAHLVCSYGEPQWTEFVSFPVCRERDSVLLLTGKTHLAVTKELLDKALKIVTVFASAYRYLHSQSVIVQPGQAEPTRRDLLSRREVECLQWLALGKTLSEAATILGISERTLRFHISNAKDRLGVATTMQTVVAAALVYGFDPSDTRQSIYTASRSLLRDAG